MPTKITQEIIEKAINEYKNNNISIVECATNNNIGATTLTRYLKKRDIKIKKNNGNIYSYNENYFEIIDSEEKAYWLGFIAADGSIVNNGTILEISLSSKDKEHLIKMVNALDGDLNMIKDRNQKAGNGKCYPTSRLNVCSTKLCNDLYKLNIVPNKGFILNFPSNISKELMKHYLRGYFDGDGSICTNGKNRNGSPKWSVNLIATKEFLEEFMYHIMDIGITKVSLQKRGPMMSWNKVGINQINRFLTYLYEESNIHLDRKYKLFKNICRSESKSQKTQNN